MEDAKEIINKNSSKIEAHEILFNCLMIEGKIKELEGEISCFKDHPER